MGLEIDHAAQSVVIAFFAILALDLGWRLAEQELRRR